MPIKGLTDRGLAFPEIGRIRKGAKKLADRPGPDLDYFRFDMDEEEQAATEILLAAYGARPKEIRIILPFNEIDRCWDAFLEAYTAGRMVARSDGENVLYRVDDKGEIVVLRGVNVYTGQPEAHPIDNVAGRDYKGRPVEYKAVGRLRCIIPELARPVYIVLTTGSKHDIMNITSQLEAFRSLNNGHIAGIPFILRRRPKSISVPKPDGTRVRMNKSLISIEVDQGWTSAKLQELNRLALPGGFTPLPEPEETEGADWEEDDTEMDEQDDGADPGWTETSTDEPFQQALPMDLDNRATPAEDTEDEPDFDSKRDKALELAKNTLTRRGSKIGDLNLAQLKDYIEAIEADISQGQNDEGTMTRYNAACLVREELLIQRARMKDKIDGKQLH